MSSLDHESGIDVQPQMNRSSARIASSLAQLGFFKGYPLAQSYEDQSDPPPYIRLIR